MIDIEGLGTGPDATILTIAAQSFDPFGTGYYNRQYYARITLESQENRSIQQDTIDWWATQPEAQAEGSFPPSEVTFHVPTASCCVRGSGRRGSCLRLPPDPHCTGPLRLPLWVVNPQEVGPTSPLRAEPGRAPWAKARPPGARIRAPTPGLAPGWGPGCAIPGDVTVLDIKLIIRGFVNCT